jgi:hypothetical protein
MVPHFASQLAAAARGFFLSFVPYFPPFHLHCSHIDHAQRQLASHIAVENLPRQLRWYLEALHRVAKLQIIAQLLAFRFCFELLAALLII